MRKLLLPILAALSLLSAPARAALFWPSTPTTVHSLYPSLDLGGVGGVLTGSADPSSVATAGAPGTIYERSNGNVYFKTDSGTTTSWFAIGTGTVTNIGLTAPAFMSVSGSPVNSSGTLGLSFNSEAANSFLAGPVGGGASAVSFRSLVAADLAVAVTPGSSGNVLTSNGSTWTSAPNSSGATTALDNLASTAVNADIIPGAPGTINLGSVSNYYNQFFANGIRLRGNNSYIQSEGGGLSLYATITDEPILLDAVAGSITLDSEKAGISSTGNKIYTHGDIYMGLTTGATPTWRIKLLQEPVDPPDAATKNYVDTAPGVTTALTPTTTVGRDSAGSIQDLDPSYVLNLVYTFFGYQSAADNGGLNSSNSGSGSQGCTPAGGALLIDIAHPGNCQLKTGTTSSGSAMFMSGQEFIYGAGPTTFDELAYQPVACDNSTNECIIWIGFGNSFATGSTDFSIGAYFKIDSTANSGNIQICSGTGVAVCSNTSTAFSAATWTHFVITSNAAATLLTFYVNGVSIGTINSSIPHTTGAAMILESRITKLLGASDRDLDVNYIKYQQTFTTPR